MKLGEVYFRVEDFANAETQFAQLVEDEPTSPYAEKALYLAGQSAMRLGMNANALDRALAFFDRVVKRDGPLKLYARQEQAIAQSRGGREAEAIALYDIILSAQPAPEPELGFAALCGKGDNLAALGRHDPKSLEKAVAIFDQLAVAPNVTAFWRNQALYKKGKTQVQLGRTAAALSAYNDVLEKSGGSEREHFWSSKAGFDAGAILEQQRQWRGAIGIYSKLAALGGPRALEADARVKQLRLDHFVWD
jgi:tetratricopeptide (TPR) repeat protein